MAGWRAKNPRPTDGALACFVRGGAQLARVRSWSVVGWMVVGVLAGCAQVPRQTSLMAKVPGVHMSTAELRQRVIELGRRQVALVEAGVASASDAFGDADTQRAALTWGLAAVP